MAAVSAPQTGPGQRDGRVGQADSVVLVDEFDREIGLADKLEAHLGAGRRHRAFSVFLHDGRGRILLQRRAASKYHFGGLWSNACCSHPRPAETVLQAARRRLGEEIGLAPLYLKRAGQFEYRATDPASGLVEHELDHVVVGSTTRDPQLNPSEADAFCWIEVARLQHALAAGQLRVTPWFRPALDVVLASGVWPPETREPRFLAQ